MPRLRACDGNTKCLAELGALLSADTVIYGEVGGLGNVQVVYLKAVNVARAKELRSTTLEFGGHDRFELSQLGSGGQPLGEQRFARCAARDERDRRNLILGRDERQAAVESQ